MLYYFLKQGIFLTAERYIPFVQIVYTLLPGVKVGAHAKALQWVRLNLHSWVVVLEIHPSPQVRSARGRLLGLSDSTYKVNTIASILVAIVAVEHLYILWIEMFAWTSKGRKVFKGALPDELFDKTRGLAANQGLYNGFLSAGLFWGLLVSDPIWSFRIQLFFLLCVLMAATFGAIRSSFSILLKQGLPAALALLFLLLSAL